MTPPDTLPVDSNFLGLEPDASGFTTSRTVILPCPLEFTTSYGRGTAGGPAALLRASHQVELYDEETGTTACGDGIATLPPQDYSGLTLEASVDRIADGVSTLLTADKFPVVLGGEHTVTVGSVRAFKETGAAFSVLQLDAHSDLRDSYEDSPLSHACALRRVRDMGVHHVGVGIRSQCEEERRYAETEGLDMFYACRLQPVPDWEAVIDRLQDAVYLTIDLDFLDPSIMPATGTPEPGGFLWHETCDLLRRLIARRRLIGLDIVELAPIPGLHHADYTAARLLYKILGYRHARLHA
jgi:agmatinase